MEKGSKLVDDDDLDPFECDTKSKNDRKMETITNNLELAIYHCKGNIFTY